MADQCRNPDCMWWLAECHECATTRPFDNEHRRNEWANEHTQATAQTVDLTTEHRK